MDDRLFGGRYTVDRDAWPPELTADMDTRLLAHTFLAGDPEPEEGENRETGAPFARGEIEPLVGRETDPGSGYSGVLFSQACICYAPGAAVDAGLRFSVGHHGMWQRVD
jgi:hypothetical protein